jgi:Fur family transcriptional regulator, ferric uptake regulator
MRAGYHFTMLPDTPTRWADHAVARLEHSGHRWGSARRAVVEVLAGQSCCLTAQQIADRLRAQGADVGLASVYRALELLSSLRLVHRLDVGDGTARYERTDPSGEHHHHLVCDRCGAVAAFEDDGLEHAIEALSGRLDFEMGGHDIVLRGTCRGCDAV